MLASLIVFKMPGGQVNVYDTALAALAILGTPALGMQAAFAAQAAVIDDPQRLKSLAATMRATFLWLTFGWLLLAGACLPFTDQILLLYGLTDPLMLWVLLVLGLVILLTPIPNGVIQGKQDFLWFGLGTLLNGASRFVVLAAVVFIFKLGALGGLVGVLSGSLVVLLIVLWRTSDVLVEKGGTVDWSIFLRRAIPLTFGLGALVAIMQADALIVREKLQSSLSTEEIVGYTAARRIGQILVYLVGAVVAVMYPKIARGFQKTEPSDALKLTVTITTLVSIVGALATSLIPHVPLRILAGSNASAESATLVIAFVWALVPLAISNVLVWNLMARECYRSVPFLVLIAGGYWLALRSYNDRLLTVITVLGIFSLTTLVVSALFTVLDLRAMKVKSKPVSA